MDYVRGLNTKEVLENRKRYGTNTLPKKSFTFFAILLRQLKGNPLIMVLIAATTVSLILGERASSAYIFLMIMLSIVLGFWNEYSAEKTIEGLLKKVTLTCVVLRNGARTEIPVSEIVVNDICFLTAGDIIPADIKLIESKNLEVDESVLTGESIPVYKKTDDEASTGTIVLGGWSMGTVTKVGKETQFGKIAQSASFIKPETEFQKGLMKFGKLLVKVIVILTVSIFVINFALGKPFLTSLLFALAIAVGLTPELLPVIVTISLSHGAGKLAKKHVIAKQLISVENLGNMDVLCTDKTGTLTEGRIELVRYLPEWSKEVVENALYCNAAILGHKNSGNSIDLAIWDYANKNSIKLNKRYVKLDEEPFDYEKKISYSVIKNISADQENDITLISKGAPEEILALCKTDPTTKKAMLEYIKQSSEGYRVVAVASKKIRGKNDRQYGWADVNNLDFVGFLLFMDVPKKDAREALLRLKKLHVDVKILTGDNEIITRKICIEVGLEYKDILLGTEIDGMSDEFLTTKLDETDIYARLNPEQKLRIIQLYRKKGHTVGYLGDGINDIPSLRSADVGISVNTGADVAKDAASIVLLRKGLDVIADGVLEGRITFSNTIKYILMGTSSNFGNMFSAAVSSFVLPFLPMTPAQILLNNGLYDISQLPLPTDNVDHEALLKPKHWNVDSIKKYMLFFGPISSVYDFITFGIMYYVFHARGALFQTGWFIESLATQVLVVFVIRTFRIPFFRSKPGKWLVIVSFAVVATGVLLPFTSLAGALGLVTPPPLYFGILATLVVTYLAIVEISKKLFLKRFSL